MTFFLAFPFNGKFQKGGILTPCLLFAPETPVVEPPLVARRPFLLVFWLCLVWSKFLSLLLTCLFLYKSQLILRM